MRNSDLIPEQPPVTQVTPQMIADAERRIADMKKAGTDPHDIAAVVEAHRQMVNDMNNELQSIALAGEVRRLTR